MRCFAAPTSDMCDDVRNLIREELSEDEDDAQIPPNAGKQKGYL
jgi:hypothetical protein